MPLEERELDPFRSRAKGAGGVPSAGGDRNLPEPPALAGGLTKKASPSVLREEEAPLPVAGSFRYYYYFTGACPVLSTRFSAGRPRS